MMKSIFTGVSRSARNYFFFLFFFPYRFLNGRNIARRDLMHNTILRISPVTLGGSSSASETGETEVEKSF